MSIEIEDEGMKLVEKIWAEKEVEHVVKTEIIIKGERVVFKGLVRSSLLPLRGLDWDRDWSS